MNTGWQPGAPAWLPAFLGGPAAAPQPALGATPVAPTPSVGADAWVGGPSAQLEALRQDILALQQALALLVASVPAPQPVVAPIPVAPSWPSATPGYVLVAPPTPMPAWSGPLPVWLLPQAPAAAPAPTPAPAPAPVAPPPAPAPQPGPATPPAQAAKGPTRFVLSSFNVLSSSAGAGKGYASGTARMRSVVDIIQANQVSVVGFQEMDHAQMAEFRRLAGKEYGSFTGDSGKKNYFDTALAWRKDEWDLVKGATITVPSYAGIDSKVPYVRLRNKQTGQEAYFIDAHNPANTKKYHHQERFRDAAARMEAALADRLMRETGLPVFVVGDMNSVREAQAIFTQGGELKAANGPKQSGIDWIFGSKDVAFSNFRRTREGAIARTTDHPVVFADVKIPR